jgi:hypothetical protein
MSNRSTSLDRFPRSGGSPLLSILLSRDRRCPCWRIRQSIVEADCFPSVSRGEIHFKLHCCDCCVRQSLQRRRFKIILESVRSTSSICAFSVWQSPERSTRSYFVGKGCPENCSHRCSVNFLLRKFPWRRAISLDQRSQCTRADA